MAQAPKNADQMKTAPYVVKGSDIWTSKGRVKDGSVVELPAHEARHFTKIGRLAPYIPDDDISERVND